MVAHGKLVLKSDQEPAIVDVLKEVAKVRGTWKVYSRAKSSI